MTFYDISSKMDTLDLENRFNEVKREDVVRATSDPRAREEELRVLLSPCAEDQLEKMARRAHDLTVQHFGRTMLLFTPMYLSNYCVNQCAYCGFNIKNDIPRKKLTIDETEKEARYLASKGFKHILILTGESRGHSPVGFISERVDILKEYFSSVSIEVYPLEEKEYSILISDGVDGVVLFQETYNEKVYDLVHIAGPKKNYRFRLDAPERAAKAGMRTVNIGALLGLNDWRADAFLVGMHAKYLQDKYPDCEISISVPRIREHAGTFDSVLPVSDRNLVQMIVALRIFLPRVGFTLSTRENTTLRDHLIPLGITKMSAESDTSVGGHTLGGSDHSGGQFEISDKRSLEEIKAELLRNGYQPIMKDWVGVQNETRR
jgi:2-iminoacetate synthase